MWIINISNTQWQSPFIFEIHIVSIFKFHITKREIFFIPIVATFIASTAHSKTYPITIQNS